MSNYITGIRLFQISDAVLFDCTNRNMLPVRDAEGREKVERLYVCSQTYHHLHCAWWNLTFPWTTFSLSAATILCLYVGFRHTELPWYLYWLFWITGFGVLVDMFWFGHDVMFAKQTSEEIVDRLQSPASADLQSLSREERNKMLKRAKALAGLQFGIASFTNYTWAVTFGTCDEILNQLIFLLTL